MGWLSKCKLTLVLNHLALKIFEHIASSAMNNSKYGPWIAEVPGARSDAVKLRLFCVPPVGMGGASFHHWVSGWH